jgi:hypothetical protein
MHSFPIRGELFFALMLIAGLVYVGQLRRRLEPIVAEDPSLRAGARVLVMSALIVILAATVVQGALQYFGGFSYDVAWWASCDLSNPYIAAELILQILFALVVLWWAWLADGPVRIQKYRAALVGGYQNPFVLGPTGLRWFLTIVPVGFLIMRGMMLLACRNR